jgi:Predicted phosphoesterases, related to the Icc protein
MKIQIKSDLHKETRPQAYRAQDGNSKSIMHPDADILILAGDITDYANRFALYHELTRFDRPILYVPGNHEYYRADHVRFVLPELKALYKGTNVTVLDRDFVNIRGVAFIGATLWTNLTDPLKAESARNSLNDFRVPGLDPGWYTMQHIEAVKFLKQALELHSHLKRVVITHHAPSHLSIHPRYVNNQLNCCFVSNQSDLMLDYEPQLWVHGHTHDPFDYNIGKTRVICNPKGYPGEKAQTRLSDPEPPTLIYNEDLIVEI